MGFLVFSLNISSTEKLLEFFSVEETSYFIAYCANLAHLINSAFSFRFAMKSALIM